MNQRPFGDQLPDIPPLDLEQGDNMPLNPPNQPQNLPVGEENQQNQAQEPNQGLPPEQEEHNHIVQPPNQPNQSNQPNQPPNPFQNLPVAMANPQQLNWSYFKPEFSGKPEEDVEAHLLRTNDWMETHNFPNDQKVRRFCLTLMGEARLWYETLGAAQLDWEALQDHFWQQYSKFGNTQEQYFHAWRSFQFDESTNTIDSYIHKVKQVVALLNYGNHRSWSCLKALCPVNYIIWYIT